MRRWLVGLLLAAGLLALGWYVATRRPAAAPQERPVVLAPRPDAQGFARAEAPAPFSFPQDFGPHPEYQTEWWYYTGNLVTPDGRRFGYQFTLFRRGLLPPEAALTRGSEWAATQVYMGHFALTDVDGGEQHAFERFNRGAAGLAGAGSPPYRVWLEDWRVESSGELPAGTPGAEYRLVAGQDGVQIDLALTDLKGPVLQGVDGYSRKGPEPGNASYYFSQTRLQTGGTLTVGGRSYAVEGFSWMDHEYSTSALTAGDVGWDWFALQLDDGTELKVFHLRRADGSLSPYSSGSFVDKDGNIHRLEAGDFSITPTGTWRSPHSKAEYPAGWLIEIPRLGLRLEVEPLLADQELNVSYAYWEGAVRVGGSAAGYGYAELTGYAGSMAGEF